MSHNGEIIIKLDRNKLIQPVDTEAEEISYEELKAIPSERGCGSLGSSGKWRSKRFVTDIISAKKMITYTSGILTPGG